MKWKDGQKLRCIKEHAPSTQHTFKEGEVVEYIAGRDYFLPNAAEYFMARIQNWFGSPAEVVLLRSYFEPVDAPPAANAPARVAAVYDHTYIASRMRENAKAEGKPVEDPWPLTIKGF